MHHFPDISFVCTFIKHQALWSEDEVAGPIGRYLKGSIVTERHSEGEQSSSTSLSGILSPMCHPTPTIFFTPQKVKKKFLKSWLLKKKSNFPIVNLNQISSFASAQCNRQQLSQLFWESPFSWQLASRTSNTRHFLTSVPVACDTVRTYQLSEHAACLSMLPPYLRYFSGVSITHWTRSAWHGQGQHSMDKVNTAWTMSTQHRQDR